MAITLRPYQVEAIEAGVNFFTDKKEKKHALMILTTGAGKSIVIAGITGRLPGRTLILQPSIEILVQNFRKYCHQGFRAGIYSASAGLKHMDDVTFATIGSIAKKHHLLQKFDRIIIDECHGVNAEDGLYRSLIDSFDKIKVLGLTATPYRLSSDGMGGSMLKFLTRTRPKIFSKVIYYIQNSVLFDAGHLASLEYYSFKTIDRGKLELNTTGTDFTESSLKEAYAEVDMTGKIIHYANRILQKRKNLLVFCTTVNEAHLIAAAIPGAVAVTGDTDKELRKKYLRELQDGKRSCVVTCGVWSTGADIPNLEAVLLGFTTMSLAVYYQRLGRVIRPYTYPDGTKKTGWVVDLGGNIHLFGKVETMQIIKSDNDLYAIWNKTKTGIRQLTNCTFRKI
jgi:DNA repair protein RadD